MRRALVTFVLLTSQPLWAQAPASAPPSLKRPRTALVLEGGGALGLAHISVLKWLEENRIPIDYVTGTSMGGLVGGLYASGKTPAEISTLTQAIKWDVVLRGQVPFEDRSYRRKQDKIAYPNRLEFGTKGGFNLPAGLNSGQDVGFILDRSLLPYYEMKSFDDLPIPFRCVATDLTAGQKKVFDHGTLSQALRATMSIPFVFAPTVIDGRLYTDGAAVDNLPVDVAKDMGAEVVIAVYLDTGQPDPKTFNTITGAASRNIAIMISANELQSIQQADVLISVDLKQFTSGDFNLGAAIEPRGYAAAEKKKALLSRFSVSPDEWAAYIKARDARKRTLNPNPSPAFVTVSGLDDLDTKSVEASLAPILGKPVDSPELEQRLTRLTGLGYFSSLNYGLIDQNGKTGLAIRGAQKTYGPPFLDLGITLDGAEPSDVKFGMSARLTVLHLWGVRSEWRTDAFFGTNYGVVSEFYKPFNSTTKWFLAPHGYATSNYFDIYQNNNQISSYSQSRVGVGLDLGYIFNPKSEIRFGQDYAAYGTHHKSGLVLGADSNLGLGISKVSYKYYGQDSSVLPRRGYVNESTFQYFTERPNGGGYESAESRNQYFKEVSQKASVFVTASGGSAFGAKNLELQSFTLGGPFRLSAYGRNELLGNQYFLFQGGATYELFRLNPLIGTNVSAMAFYEVGKVYGGVNLPSLPQDGALALVMRTAFGPIFAGAAFGDSSHHRWWFGLGRVF
jgi:NTE family protein